MKVIILLLVACIALASCTAVDSETLQPKNINKRDLIWEYPAYRTYLIRSPEHGDFLRYDEHYRTQFFQDLYQKWYDYFINLINKGEAAKPQT